MTLKGKYFMFPASDKETYNRFIHVKRENYGIIVCTLLVPERPHTKESTVLWDPSDLEGAVEIPESAYKKALKSL